jgi:hypothetical protein
LVIKQNSWHERKKEKKLKLDAWPPVAGFPWNPIPAELIIKFYAIRNSVF